MVGKEDDTPPASPGVSDMLEDLDDNDMVEVIEIDQMSDYDMEDEDDEGLDNIEEDEGMIEDIVYKPDRDDAESVFQLHKSAVLSCAFHPSPPHDIVATGGMDEYLYVWNLNNKENPQPLLAVTFPDSVDCVKFSHDGTYLAASDIEGNIKVFNGKDFSLHCEFQLGDDLRVLIWHQLAPVLVAAGETLLMMYNIPTQDCKSLPTANGSITCGKILPDGKRFAYGTTKGNIRVLDMKAATASVSVTLEPTNADSGEEICIYTMDVHKDGSIIVFGCDVGNVIMVNADNGKYSYYPTTASDEESVEVITFAKLEAHKNLVASGHRSGMVKIWDSARQALRCSQNFEESVVSLIWHPNEAVVFSCHPNAKVHLTDALTGRILKTFLGHTKSILAMDISPDASRMITVSDDLTTRIYKVKETSEHEEPAAAPVPLPAPASATSS